MKKIMFIVLALTMLFTCSAHASESVLIDMRDQILVEAGQLSAMMADSKAVVAVNSMWNGCVVTVTQLNGYFIMLGIFGSIKEDALSEDPIKYMNRWLEEIRKTNEGNVQSLSNLSIKVDSKTLVHVEKLKAYYGNLNTVIDAELKRVSLISESLKLR